MVSKLVFSSATAPLPNFLGTEILEEEGGKGGDVEHSAFSRVLTSSISQLPLEGESTSLSTCLLPQVLRL